MFDIPLSNETFLKGGNSSCLSYNLSGQFLQLHNTPRFWAMGYFADGNNKVE